jgi:hypothetical protein
MNRVCCLALLTAACGVPKLDIIERSSVSSEPDAGAAPSDSETTAPDAGTLRPSQRPTGGASAQTGATSRAGSAAMSGGRGGMLASAAGASGSPGQGGERAPDPPQTTAGAGGEPAPNEPEPPTMMQPSACAVWVSVNVRDPLPEGAVEGGFENVTGVTNRQYVCRIRPDGDTYAIPGKYVTGLGCYVIHRVDGEPMDASVVGSGSIEVLTAAPGCTFSWRSASPAMLPRGAIDLGNPVGGPNYACRGDYSSFGSSGKQIGSILLSSDDPPQNQCWFESFANAIQPSEPAVFEVLVQD